MKLIGNYLVAGLFLVAVYFAIRVTWWAVTSSLFHKAVEEGYIVSWLPFWINIVLTAFLVYIIFTLPGLENWRKEGKKLVK